MNKFLWLVRRELWEARTVWVAPALCAAIIVGGALIAAFGTGTISFQGLDPDELAKLHDKLTPEKLDGIASLALGAISTPFFIMVMFTQIFYAIDSLYGERRDRAILFWKSLPVSDAQAVLSKLLVGAVVMPAAAAAAAIVSQLVVFSIASAKLAPLEIMHGHLWTPQLWAGSLAVTGYVLIGVVLWTLPVIGWCLAVSAWAPRSPVMYATLPPLGIALGEYIVFHSHHVWTICMERLSLFSLAGHAFGGSTPGGGIGLVIDEDHMQVPRSLLATMRPGHFFGSAEVWLGAAIGVALVVAAIGIRRSRDEAA